MSRGGVPDWFGQDDKPGARKRPTSAVAPAEVKTGGEPPQKKPALAAAMVIVLAGLGAGVFVAMRPDSNAKAEARRSAAESAERARLLEAMKQSAAEPAEEVPDPSELPSIEEVIAEDEAEAEGASGDAGATNADAAAGARDTASVLRITRALNPEFRRCYQQELVANPGAKGRADVTLTIAPEGRVSKVQVELSGNLSQNARGCVASAVRKAQFEPAAEEATVKLPILLQSG